MNRNKVQTVQMCFFMNFNLMICILLNSFLYAERWIFGTKQITIGMHLWCTIPCGQLSNSIKGHLNFIEHVEFCLIVDLFIV